MRVEHMERQLANLTGLVQKALIQGPQVPVIAAQNYLGVPGQYRGGMLILRNSNLIAYTLIEAIIYIKLYLCKNLYLYLENSYIQLNCFRYM